MCSFADDSTFYACDMDLSSLIKRLEHDNMGSDRIEAQLMQYLL